MGDEAEIVKELRELEKSGALNIDKFSFNKSSEEFNKADMNYEINSDNKCYFDNSINFKNLNGKLYQKLVEKSLEGILIIDLQGKILFSNPAVLNIFGFNDNNDIVGKNFLDLIHPDYRDKLIKDQKLLFIGKNGVLNTYKAMKADGEKIWIEGLGCKTNFINEIAIAIFIRDISHRQKTWYELVKLGDKYKALADMSTDGIIIIDHLGRITYTNTSFERLCNKNKNQLNGKSFRDFLSGNSIYQFQELFIGARKTGKTIKDVELEFLNYKNEIIPIELSLSPLKNTNNEFTGIACTIHDITVHKQIENELKKSKKLKTEFMNIAAHELKSPITPIKGYLDLIISDSEVNHNTKKWGKISLRNTERLLQLVNDILDVSRLDSDTMSFNMEKMNPTELINEVAEDIEPILKKKKISLIKKFSKEATYILGDKHRFEQVIKNILGNAIKFTDKGKIVLESKIIDDKLIITIEDTGIGMSYNDLEKIFTKFFQSYTGHDRKYEGTGLGLFICREIIKRHNGKIWAESKLGEGSKFYIEIPII
jgi:PAS domain S-box-containing protein